MKKKRHISKGFTLIELLVVIAIIAILAVVVVLTLNPAELLRQSRDSNRISDFATLKSALSLYLVDSTSPNLASTTFGYGSCYLSSTSGNGTTTAKCGTFTNTYTSNVSTTSSLYRGVSGTGWIPVNFSGISEGTPFSSLPVDPVNNSQNYYAYAATTTGGYLFELDTFMESKKYGYNGTNDVVSGDGGNSTSTYEVGNAPGLSL